MIPVFLHCDSCGKMHNANDIYEFHGNVMHPCGGGYVGQNIFNSTAPDFKYNKKAEDSREIQIAEYNDGEVRIYALRYCRTCCARIFDIEYQPTNKAAITYTGRNGDVEIKVNGHMIQFGGADGDGYCYAHQSFDCLDNLTTAEWSAINRVIGENES